MSKTSGKATDIETDARGVTMNSCSIDNQGRSASSRLFADLEAFGERTALIDETGTEVSYTQLLERAARMTQVLGDVRRLVFIEMSNRLASIAAYVGAVRAGHAVVLTGEGGSSPNARLVRVFEPEFVFAGEGFENRDGGPTVLHDDLAVLLSTSGSTGSPKLVRLSHRNLISNAQSIAEYLGFEPGERAITSLPPSYSYGMSVINSHLQAGHALILSEESVISPVFWDSFNRHGGTSLAGVPYTFELLERGSFMASPPPSLRYLTQAGGRMAADRIGRWAAFAQSSKTRFYVMYGQTEAAPRMAYMPPQHLAERPDSIGRAIPGGHLRLDTEGMAESPDGVGELVYSGPNVMMGYALTRGDLALGPQLRELRTGDLASIDAEGFVRIVGRASRFSKIFGLRISLDEVETLLADAGLVGAAAGDDEGLVVATTAASGLDAVRKNLAEQLKLPLPRVLAIGVDDIPRQASGKIDYPAILRLRSDAEPVATQPQRQAGAVADQSLRKQMAELLGVERIGDDDTFVGLGGDSLSYVQAAMVLEATLGAAPEGWEQTPFKVLEQGAVAEMLPAAAKAAHERVTTIESSVFVRALAIVGVVLHHITNWHAGGSATALLIVAGMNFARFQLPQMEAGRSRQILQSTFIRVVLPYFLVLALYFVVIGKVFWPQLLLYSNFTEGLVWGGARRFSSYWFIEIYINLIALFGLLFMIPQVRAFSLSRPKALAMGVLAITVSTALLARLFGDFPLFYVNTPFTASYVFAYGWLVEKLKSPSERIAALLVGLATFAALPSNGGLVGVTILATSGLLLLFVKKVPVGVFAKPLSLIAGASLYIYIFHTVLIHLARSATGGHETVPGWMVAPMLIGTILIGIALWHGVQLVTIKRIRGVFTRTRALAQAAT